MISRLVLVGLLCFNAVSFAQKYVISTVAGGIPPATPTDAAFASIGDPPRVAVDSAGNVYFASLHSVFKVDKKGTLNRIAGTGHTGSSGDGGLATNALLNYPDGLAIDPSGNVYFTDRAAHVIRRISTNGIISTIAGTGKAGFSGDGGPATSAQLSGPTGRTRDSAGNLYVAVTDNSCVRLISTDGTITTIAGTNSRAYGGDGGPARMADLNGPQGLAVDSSRNLYIADTLNNRIRMVTPDGTITSFAGTGTPGSAGDNGPAVAANLFLPTDVAVDPTGAVLIADLGSVKVRKVTNGKITTVAGNATSDVIPADGVKAVSVRMNGPTGVAAGADGSFYFAAGGIGSGSGLTTGDYKIWRVTPTGLLATLAGIGSRNFSGDGGPSGQAQLDTPAGMAMDRSGNLYFADTANHRVRKIGTDGTITTVAGFGVPGFAGEKGPAVAALLNSPTAVAFDSDGHLYISDTGNNRIREVLDNGNIGTFAGNGNAGLFGDGGDPLDAALHAPHDIVFDDHGNLYIADTLNHRIRKIDSHTNTIDTYAGRGQGLSGDGGPALNALLNSPTALALDAAGNLYIADQGNNRVRKVSANGTITAVAGTATVFTGDGGAATDALVNTPRGLAVDRAGNLYISEMGENRIRVVGTDGKISTIAGTGDCCYANDGGAADTAQLNAPWGLALDPSSGNLFIADAGNSAIRVLQAAPSGPVQATVANAGSFQAGAVAPGEIVVITGTNLGPSQPVQAQPNASGIIGTQLGGVSVLFNGIFAPILYASAKQITAIVPYGVSGGTAQVVGQYQSLITLTTSVALTSASPALLTSDATGKGQAAAINAGGEANNAAHPVATGSVITLYATGEGLTSPAGTDGKLGVAPLPTPVLPVTLSIGGIPATVQSAGGEAGTVAGVMRIDAVVPAGVQVGSAVPVVVSVGGISSPPGVTIAVR
jgi:uncharacterized protein (TIGR03437 family)